MRDVDGKRPIIIIKRPVIAPVHHGGAWKIAFADFMTAMFAFFLVMWLMSSSSAKQLEGIAKEFKMPLKVALSGGTKIANSKSVIPGGGDDSSHKEGEVRKSERDSGTDAGSTSSSETDDGKRNQPQNGRSISGDEEHCHHECGDGEQREIGPGERVGDVCSECRPAGDLGVEIGR